MRLLFPLFVLIHFYVITSWAQTNTTTQLTKKYKSISLFFYKNTLRMLNQKNDKNFDTAIKDIEKMRLMMLDKEKQKFLKADFEHLKKEYQSEGYEPVMTTRTPEIVFDVFLKELKGKVKGTVIVASNSKNVYIFDLLGSIPLNKIDLFFTILNDNTMIAEELKQFTSKE